MKRRYADLHVRKRVQNGNIKITSTTVSEKNFKGDIYFYDFIEVSNKFVMSNGKCILDNNYKWLEFYDYNSKVKLTAMYDENNKIIEWYFDIAKEIGKENGYAYEEDLYLDVVVTNSGEIILLDEDELKEALENNEITKSDYENAYKEEKQLMERLKDKKDELQKFTDGFLNLMLSYKW